MSARASRPHELLAAAAGSRAAARFTFETPGEPLSVSAAATAAPAEPTDGNGAAEDHEQQVREGGELGTSPAAWRIYGIGEVGRERLPLQGACMYNWSKGNQLFGALVLSLFCDRIFQLSVVFSRCSVALFTRLLSSETI